jgi:hypothetical protein
MSDPIQAAAEPLHHWLRLHNPDWDEEQYEIIARAVVAAYLKARHEQITDIQKAGHYSPGEWLTILLSELDDA